MVATDLHESPRARALKDKDLLKEFRWYRKNASALDAFADRLCVSLLNPKAAWPNKPKLPSREEKKIPPLRHQGSQQIDK